MTEEDTNDIRQERDCKTCVWRSEDGCHSWDCDYISYHTLHQYIEQHPEIRGTK